MNNLLLILLFIFAGVALMVLAGRYAKPVDRERTRQLQRWILPLVGLSLVLSLIKYYW